MKKILIVSALILVNTSLMAVEKADSKERKVTVTSTFNFKAGDAVNRQEMAERLRRELLRNQRMGQQSSAQRDIQKSEYIEEIRRQKQK